MFTLNARRNSQHELIVQTCRTQRKPNAGKKDARTTLFEYCHYGNGDATRSVPFQLKRAKRDGRSQNNSGAFRENFILYMGLSFSMVVVDPVTFVCLGHARRKIIVEPIIC